MNNGGIFFVFIGIVILAWIYDSFSGKRKHDNHGVNCFCCRHVWLGYAPTDTDPPSYPVVCACQKGYFYVAGTDIEEWHDSIILALECQDFQKITVAEGNNVV